MALPYTTRVALITGGSAGLGAATARAFAAAKMRVVINYSNDSKRADSVIDSLYKISPNITGPGQDGSERQFMAIKADVSSPREIASLVEQTVSAMGRLDVVFSNHGWTRLTDFNKLDENMDSNDWDRCFNMNVKSHLYLMHAARKHLEESEGSFIVTSSVAGVKAAGSSLAYAVTKAAQIHLAKCLAGITAPRIRVNCVSPGMMLTEWSSSFPAAKKEATIKKGKLGRLATVEDVAQQVCTFATSRSVTGANAIIDAGFSL